MTSAIAAQPRLNRRQFFQQFGLLIVFLLLCLALSLISDRFLTGDNLKNVLRQSTVNGIIAVGVMFVILTRGIDLSVGSVLAMSSIVGADLLQQGWAPFPAVLAALVVGGLLGLITGLLVSQLRIPPFIATLGMMTFGRGLAFSVTGGTPISSFPDGFRLIGTGEFLGIPTPIIIAAGVFLVAYGLLYHTTLGRFMFALGSNERAAFVSGIPNRLVLLSVYVFSGMMSALAGIILIARLNSAQPSIGEGYELDAIAAVVVGGTTFDGGEGTLLGTLLGVLIIAVLNNGLNLLNVPPEFVGVVKGVVIVVALLLHRALR
ncbi:MAG: ribose ABC transporter permease [Chloroflexi bacterium]|uniref:ABC transporter permease n=1 Tax=Candidatus Flexifilum breve TaxID=3140694 RepID=UPI0031357622|nr:ribose ABC transporter permease [Chloroflexota bacterium]MBK9750359.1 ribose ABC transporter permease [Chloroflexota bacterium]